MSTSKTAEARVANLSLVGTEKVATLTATVPHNIHAEDLTRLSRSIIDVIKGHTGCACLSGQIRVVLEEELAKVVRVDLGAVAGGGRPG